MPPLLATFLAGNWDRIATRSGACSVGGMTCLAAGVSNPSDASSAQTGQ